MEFELKTNSWHFWLANFGWRRVREWRDDNDFCSYTRAFLKGLLLFIVVYGLALIGVGLTINMLYELYEFFINGIELSVFAEIAYVCYISSFGIFSIMLIAWFIAEKAIPTGVQAYQKVMYGKRKQERPPTFLALLYRKFKDKTCFKIKFKSQEE